MAPKVEYVEVPRTRAVTVMACWSAPGTDPNTLSQINTVKPMNFGGLDETVTLYTVFEAIDASVRRKVTADINGKVFSTAYGCGGGNAWISLNFAASNASVSLGIKSICNHLSAATNYTRYAGVISTFVDQETGKNIRPSKEAFMAAATAQWKGVEDVSLLVIGKTGGLKPEHRSKFAEKASEGARYSKSRKPAESGEARKLPVASLPEAHASIKLKGAGSYLVYLYLRTVFREISPVIHGEVLTYYHKISLDKAADSAKIKDFADKVVKQLGDNVGEYLASRCAMDAVLEPSHVAATARGKYSKADIESIIKSHM